MAKIIICRGIQGSGKSTWAKQWAEAMPENRVRWSKDDMRRMMGKYWVRERETLLEYLKQSFIENAMKFNKDIVIDDMNLNYERDIKPIEKLIEIRKKKMYDHPVISSDFWRAPYEIMFIEFFTPLQTCIERDALRTGTEHIGESIITDTYNRYKNNRSFSYIMKDGKIYDKNRKADVNLDNPDSNTYLTIEEVCNGVIENKNNQYNYNF